MPDNRPLSVRNPDTVRSELLRLNMDDAMTWREIATLEPYSSIPPGTLCSIAKGASIPKKYRKQLGVILPVPVIPCEICGEVHTHKHGEQTYDPAASMVKPLRKPGKPRAPRIAIRKDDPLKAARTITKNLAPRDVEELAYYLRLYIDDLTRKAIEKKEI